MVEGFRRPSLRSGLLNPSTKGQFQTPVHLSPFELPPVSFCSRPDRQNGVRQTPEAFAESIQNQFESNLAHRSVLRLSLGQARRHAGVKPESKAYCGKDALSGDVPGK